ncbi:MAG: S41 family peptidase [Flavobacteriaceae bacterium]
MKLMERSKKYRIVFFLLLGITIAITACKKDEVTEDSSITDTTQTTENTQQDTDDTAISLEGDLQISDFVWQGLNTYYYWQEAVPNLADSKAFDKKAYAQFINNNPNPDDFFESLKHGDDRFSWIQDDYKELENLLQGIYASNGVEFGLTLACQDCTEVVGYVKYILADSDASTKEINRGDFFTGVNGTTLTVNNYRSLLFGDDLTYTLNMADLVGGALSPNGLEVELTKEENFETNPIQVHKILDTSSKKIGYLMYNQFVADKSPALNEIFGQFQSEGIDELILDLRYNGGGSVRNCIELASMITGQFTGEVFSREQWNAKLEAYIEQEFGAETLIDKFVSALSENNESINSLLLDKVAIITTSESASASELLINSLSSYIEVIHVGEQTVGKNVGSITVYDYIDNQGTKNPDHNYAMQPIVLKIANKDGFADYADGLDPQVPKTENIRDMGELGELSDPLLASAVNILTGSAKIRLYQPMHPKEWILKDPLLTKIQDMHIEPAFTLVKGSGNSIQE